MAGHKVLVIKAGEGNPLVLPTPAQEPLSLALRSGNQTEFDDRRHRERGAFGARSNEHFRARRRCGMSGLVCETYRRHIHRDRSDLANAGESVSIELSPRSREVS
jgi:hypothetical protein